MRKTLEYYRQQAQSFFSRTVIVDMAPLYGAFLSRVPAGGLVLDAGCGSGRDARAFRYRGFRVVAFDACAELASLASDHAGIPVAVRTFADVSEENCYDGIWACASLLHVPARELDATLARLWRALKPGGTLYVSFQSGSGERESEGRHFTDATEEDVRRWMEVLPDRADMRCWSSPDQRPERKITWTNALLTKKRMAADRLVTGGRDPFLPHLCSAMAKATEIDIAVAFVMAKGLRLLLPDLNIALGRDLDASLGPAPEIASGPRPRARVRILTSDYFCVTEPEALTQLLFLQQGGAHVRVFHAGTGSFHLKTYVFARFDDGGQLHGTAFVGSSNMSQTALQEGLEWNYRIDYPGDSGFLEARCRFEELFSDKRTISLSPEWIQQYTKQWKAAARLVAPGFEQPEPAPIPSSVQKEALEQLAASRQAGYRRGLVVLATGLGKTWLAVFDTVQAKAKRILFVAHREEILDQAARTFLQIRPDAYVGHYMGERRDADADVVCASVQTLSQKTHLDRFAPDHFDYVVVDEFHRAAAGTYRRLLDYFKPDFLLGLTATPQRADEADILALCDGNLVFAFDLLRGVKEKLLAPFTYFGIFDESVKYDDIPWKNGLFNFDQLLARLATTARAEHAWREWRDKRQARTLAFCVSVRHADFMAEFFRQKGVSAVAVHGKSDVSRGEALTWLKNGTKEVVFSVDLFNEGVDVPEIDTVLMLRPTESKILFLQQLGRGLRLAAGKKRLVVLDFIGNHRAFFHKPQALFGLSEGESEIAALAWKLDRRQAELTEGCFVNFDLQIIDFLKQLDSGGGEREYTELKERLGRRPSILEFSEFGGDLIAVRQRFGSWTGLQESLGDLPEGLDLDAQHFLQELQFVSKTKSFKLVLLEAFQELDGWNIAPTLAKLGRRSWEVLQRRHRFLVEIPSKHEDRYLEKEWLAYWRDMPVAAWLGENSSSAQRFFELDEDSPNGRFRSLFRTNCEEFKVLVQEMIDYKLHTHKVIPHLSRKPKVVEMPHTAADGRIRLPYFPNLKVACGHFRDGRTDDEFSAGSQLVVIAKEQGKLDPRLHFVARASGDSMNGGKRPIQDGDYLLLERVDPDHAGSGTGEWATVVERPNEAGDSEFLLRKVEKTGQGRYRLVAQNRSYPVIEVDVQSMRPWARLRRILKPEEVEAGE